MFIMPQLSSRLDLHIENIFFKISDIDGLATGELFERLGPPTQEPVKRLDGGPLTTGVPPYTVWPLWIGQGCEDVTSTDLMIADFGGAYVAKEKTPEYLDTRTTLSPPEALIRFGLIGMPADVWSLACTIFELLGDGELFESMFPDPDQTMEEIVDALGKPPEALWKAWDKRHEYFNEDGSWLPRAGKPPRVSRPLAMRIAQLRGDGGLKGIPQEELPRAEQDAILQLLRGMLTYDPEERFTMTDVVQSEWMQKYGIPAITDPGSNLSQSTQPHLVSKMSATTSHNSGDEIYEWQENAEDLERYLTGGYHPVKLGDKFCGSRYTVVHKLGKGSYSTVWLARDHQMNNYVALKIVVSEFSAVGDEVSVLSKLEAHRITSADPGAKHVSRLLNNFDIEGPNGKHACLVSEPLGCSLGVSREVSTRWFFQLPIARAIAAKVIIGVRFIHSCGVVHGGECKGA